MENQDTIIRLNKFIAHCGVCNRKQAVDLVKKGEIWVNGKVETNPFAELSKSDEVKFKGKILKTVEKRVYILINKPKDTPLQNSDESKKPSVETLIKKTSDTKVIAAHPLEDSTAGLMLLTNDEEVLAKLADKNKKVKSVFELQFDKEIDDQVLQHIRREYKDKPPVIKGINPIHDQINPTLSIEILKGSDRSIKAVFAEKGLHVVRADRTFFMGMTKKDLKRGWSRHLSEKEVIFLKYFN